MIIAYNLDKERVGVFNTIEEATKRTGTRRDRLIKCLQGKSEKANSLIWEEVKNAKIKGEWQNSGGEWRQKIEYEDEGKSFDFIKELKRELSNYKFPRHREYKNSVEEYCAIINIFDAHIDKIAFDKNVSVDEQCQIFKDILFSLLSQIVFYQPEITIFPVGSDLFNSNGSDGVTKKGTRVETDARWEENFVKGVKLIRHAIDSILLYCPQVEVPIIAGNHDCSKTFYLGTVLEAIYENEPRVRINNKRNRRKYYRYGENLFGFGHGDKERITLPKLPLIMAEEKKEDWAKTKYREWYLGDIHHKQEYKFLRTKDFPGCTVRFLRSISQEDRWHNEEGYVGNTKSAEAFLWSRNRGLVANLISNL